MSAHSGLGPLTTVGDARLLAGITAAMPTLHYADHLAVHGPLPAAVSRSAFHRVIAESGLRGRGGAGFPLAKKVESLAGRRKPVVVVNASEGEPLSRKDAVLLARVPHSLVPSASGAIGCPRAWFPDQPAMSRERRAPLLPSSRAVRRSPPVNHRSRPKRAFADVPRLFRTPKPSGT